MPDEAPKKTKEEIIRESDEKKEKLVAMVEDYVQGECNSIMLIAHNKAGIIMDIPLKGLPNFANEKLLMTELLEAHMARRITMNLERKMKAIADGMLKAFAAALKKELAGLYSGGGSKKTQAG